MELLIVIIAVVIVAVIALAFRTKPNAGGVVEQTPSTQESTPVEEAYIPEELEECIRELNAMVNQLMPFKNYVTQQE